MLSRSRLDGRNYEGGWGRGPVGFQFFDIGPTKLHYYSLASQKLNLNFAPVSRVYKSSLLSGIIWGSVFFFFWELCYTLLFCYLSYPALEGPYSFSKVKAVV